MADHVAKPGPRDGSLPALLLAVLIVGLVLFVLFGTTSSLFGVIAFALGGLVAGGILAVLQRGSGRYADKVVQ